MYGAIIGDLAGSVYEYEQSRKVSRLNIDKLLPDNCFYSDDTILTIAITDAIINSGEYGEYLKKYIQDYYNYHPDFKPYFKSPFSPSTMKWGIGNYQGISKGNGAMMRISPVGYLFDNEKEVIENAKLATIPSHNSTEAIYCATQIALIIFYLRKGISLNKIYQKLDINLNYIPFTKFNTTCSETIDNCLYALYYSNSFIDAIKRTIDMGGDTDTNAAIVGGMAEVLYGIDDYLIEYVNKKISKEFRNVLLKVRRK